MSRFFVYNEITKIGYVYQRDYGEEIMANQRQLDDSDLRCWRSGDQFFAMEIKYPLPLKINDCLEPVNSTLCII